MPQLDQATQFNAIMQYLWNHGGEFDYVTRCVGNALRGNARVNHENALDVLDTLGPDWIREMSVRACHVEADTALFTIKFWDDSSVLVVAKRGIGSAVEML